MAPRRGRLDLGGIRPAGPQEEKTLMDAENVVGLFIALALLGYLVTALIKPEKV
ncbi:K(+)-transporting ATPase subunit F [Streptomyces sp. NPDC001389]|uniref:K(+)-transporting ATPase subunit F n=1 Tax=Streptomyces sp. NPDC001389 TaxID=3364569 RepID=UPI0036A275E2